MLLGLAELSDGVTGLPVVAASLSLVGLVLIISWRLQLGIGSEIVVAVVRAAVQLLAVGVLFTAIFRSTTAIWFAAGWVIFMVTVATTVITRRAKHPIRGLSLVASTAVLGSALMSISVIFGFGVFEFDAVTLVVVSGITIGNAVPAAVLGVNLSVTFTRDAIGTLEGLLALGFDRRAVVRLMTPRIAKTALIPQIERTKVVGLIALPGALAGLLLAGVDPVEAVVVQLLVMYLVLGTAAVSLISTVLVVMHSAVTDQLVPADWTKAGSDDQP